VLVEDCTGDQLREWYLERKPDGTADEFDRLTDRAGPSAGEMTTPRNFVQFTVI